MTDEEQLDDLLDRWEEAREQGPELSADELCQDCPELADEVAVLIRDLKRADWMVDVDDEPDLDFPPLPPAESLSAHAIVPASVTLDQFTTNITISGLMTGDEVGRFEATDAQDLAAHLLRGKQLTKYQAKRIAEGDTSGLVLGNYVILDEIGAGGMGQVFKARHRRMDRVVALKVLPTETVDSPIAIDRFHQEVRAAAKLEHSNIVTAHDADDSDGTHFLVMQYVDGQDLASLVRKRGPMSVAKAVDCVIQSAKGLQYAHGVGVVHRDIKPANLLLGNDGTVKILDMGLARLEKTNGGNGNAVTQTHLTQDGAVMGTVDFMSPEQAMDTHNADARSDIYSLGCTLFYLLTGQPMYRKSSLMAKMMAHKEADIPVLHEQRGGVPADLSAVFEKMAAKEPDDRYPTVAALLVDLEAVADGLSDDESDMDTTPPQETALEVQSTETSSASYDQTIDLQDASGNVGFREGEAPAEPRLPVGSARQEPRPPGFETASTVLPKGEGTAETRSKPRVDRRKIVGRIVAVAALFGGILLAAVLLKILTPHGTVMIEIGESDEQVKVTVTDDDTIKINDPNDGKEVLVTVDAEKKTLTLRKDGFEIQTKSFNLKSKDGRYVKVTFVPAPDETPTPVGGDMDREVAEWVLSVGGSVMCSTGSGQAVSASTVDDLPDEAFTVNTIWLKGVYHVPEEQYVKPFTKLQHLKGVHTFWLAGHQNVSDRVLETIASHWSIPRGGHGRLFIGGTSISDAGLKHLSELPNLGEVDLSGLKITDAGLKHLGTLPALVHLDVGNTEITDDGMEHLVNLPLTHLGLGNCPEITDRALQYASNWPNLDQLGLEETQVTDAGLQHLEGLEKLRILALARTNVSTIGVERLFEKLPAIERISLGDVTKLPPDHEGLARLQKARPHCQISMQHGGCGSHPNPVLWRAFWVLWLDGSVQGAVEGGEPIEITNVAAAPDNLHRIISINFDDNPYLNDACAARFKSIGGLQRLSLRSTGLTNDAVDDLKSLANLEEMDLTGTKITAYGIKAIKAALPECKVIWGEEASEQGE